MNVWILLGAAAAGGVGAGLRFVVDGLVMRGRREAFPLGILIVNVTGSLALGVLVGLGAAVVPAVATVVGTGLLGGYTTFSTVSVETVLLGERGRRRHAVLNVVGTLALSLAAAAVGVLAGGAIAGVAAG